MPALRVLHVVPSYYPATIYGGPIFSIHATAQAQAACGMDVRVATTNANGASKLSVPVDRPVELAPGYHVRYYDDTIINRFSLAFTRGLPSDVRAADVVHLQDVFSAHAAWCFFLCWVLAKPLVVSVRGVFTPWGLEGKRRLAKKLWLTFLVRPFVRDSRRVLWHATAESERQETRDVLAGARIIVIPNGIELEPYDRTPVPTRRNYLKRFFPDCAVPPARACVLVAMGRLHAKKSFDTAIAALSLLARAQPDLVLLIAGADDGEGASLKAQVNVLGLQGRVCFPGELTGDDKMAFLKGGDMLLFPTHNENFGMVVLEALAAGLPVVSSRNAPWQILESRGAGLWVDNTPKAFADAVRALLARDSEDIRRRARALAAQYGVAEVAAAFEASYQELIDGHCRQRPV